MHNELLYLHLVLYNRHFSVTNVGSVLLRCVEFQLLYVVILHALRHAEVFHTLNKCFPHRNLGNIKFPQNIAGVPGQILE